jgi:hypothetical protein
MNNFEFYNPVKLVFGKGEAERVGEYAKGLGKVALIVSYREVGFYGDLFDRLKASLDANGIKSYTYFGATANPKISEAIAGVDEAKRVGAELLIGVGGGSVMDLTKVIAAGVKYPHDIRKMIKYGMGTFVCVVQREPHVPLGQGVLRKTRQDAQNGDIRVLLDGSPEHGGVAGIGHIVQDDARQPDFRLEGRHTGKDGCGGARHLGAVHGEDYRGLERACHMCGGTRSCHIATIEKASVAFDESEFGRALGADLEELAEQGVILLEIWVETGGGAACGKSEPCVVDVIRPFLAGLDSKATAAEETGEAQRNQGFATAAGKPGNDESCLFHEKRKVES